MRSINMKSKAENVRESEEKSARNKNKRLIKSLKSCDIIYKSAHVNVKAPVCRRRILCSSKKENKKCAKKEKTTSVNTVLYAFLYHRRSLSSET